jgi:hypothetical protein
MRRSYAASPLLVAAFVACASSSGGTNGETGAAPAASATSSESSRLSLNEIEAANLPTAYELVDRLRRPWLRLDAVTRGEVAVYMDNQLLGGAAKLREIPAVDVAEMQYLPNDQATQRWGSDIKGSVIVITRRR